MDTESIHERLLILMIGIVGTHESVERNRK